MPQIGEIYRDTFPDRWGTLGRRTVRIIAREPDGRWLTELVTDAYGQPPRAKARQTRVSSQALASGYEPVGGALGEEGNGNG